MMRFKRALKTSFMVMGGFGAGLWSAMRANETPVFKNTAKRPPLRWIYLLTNAGVGCAAALLAFAFADDLAGVRKRALAGNPPFTKASPSHEMSEILAIHDGVSYRPWTSMVLHHSATESGNAQRFDAYHRQHRGWRSLGYHFVIDNGNGAEDGLIETGPRWRNQESGAHANSGEYNRYGIGICLVGNFEDHSPTPAQMDSARRLVAALSRQFKIPRRRIFGHCQIRDGGGTACPGKHFPLKAFDGLD